MFNMDDSPFRLFSTLIFLCVLSSLALADDGEYSTKMSDEERQDLKEEARDMFYHAYRAYMENAYPADELMPLTCQGRWRGSQPSRGDIDDTLGNFSLTLIDSLDTLVILGDLAEFEHAVKLVIKDVSFDSDIIVSVFETNIRVLGGLLSGHILAEFVQREVGTMMWYSGELLVLAKDIGYRLLPAFNTTTGIPHARVNLRYGMKSPKLESLRETCTACAGTMILELAALSRLTGEPIFEEKAHKAMDSLWKLRHRSSDLMGTVLNVHSGDWIRRDSGVGAGIDSYYEYCLKAYVLLGHNKYLSRFNKHYSAVMKYISQGPMLLDVLMHRPHTNSRNFMDSLLAFWPGLQVLNGDLKPAVETHEMLYQVMERHTFIPEAFTTDFQVHWGQYPLRPEFLESTYFLYRATGDHYYLNVGKKILKGLQTHARVPCGYAAVNDVRTRLHDDRMDSFVLAETFKYLYLLFADPSDLILDLDKFLFTTEAHLLPLSLASIQSNSSDFFMEMEDYEGSIQKCPSSLKLFPEAVRRPLKNLVHANCPAKGTQQRKLLAANFQSGNPEHQKVISDMGISIAHLKDGRIQLLHKFSKAKSIVDGEEGLLFMQEMLELAKSQNPEGFPQAVIFKTADNRKQMLNAGPAHFGRQLHGSETVSGQVAVAIPLRACSKLVNAANIKGRIAIVQRGDCMFVEKARRIMEAGAVGGIIVDHTTDSTSASPMFAMSGDGNDDVTIPVVFLFSDDAWKLTQALSVDPTCVVTLAHRNYSEDDSPQDMNSSEELPAEIIKKIKKDLEESNSVVSDDQCDLPLRITFSIKGAEQEFGVGRMGFGAQLTGGKQLSAKIEVADPIMACSPLQNADSLKGKIVIAQTGDCKFIEKARHMMKAGAAGGIILEQSKEHLSSLDVASDNEDDVDIPVVLLHSRDYWQLLNTLLLDSATLITLSEKPPASSDQSTCSSPLEPPVDKNKQSVHSFFHNFNNPSSEEIEVGESGDEVIKISRRPAINPP